MSGDYKRWKQGKNVKIIVGEKDGPSLSFQCFENRHDECGGKVTMFPGKCDCECHAAKPTAEKVVEQK